MLRLVFDAQPVKAPGTIYIRADGSVDPPTTPIQRISNVYVFTGYIFESIVVQMDNIVIDGAGYTVLGAGTGIGIDLTERSNVTVKNVEIMTFETGIYLYSVYGWSESSYNIIFGNVIMDNKYGVRIVSNAKNNSIVGNNLTNNGVFLSGGSANNSIVGNILTNSGIDLSYSNYNKIVANDACNISLYSSSNNNIIGNSIKNGTGIQLDGYSSENVIVDNTIANNTYGVFIGYQNNVIYHNNFVNNTYEVSVLYYVNTWDDGYPSGGNYWSHYTGIDEKKGPKQDQLGSDGIGDTPYIINDYNRDRYPLMNPWIPPPETSPPTTSISISGHAGRDNWFTSDVAVFLWATDNIAVENTEYSFDNTTWTNYVAPFTIITEGHTVIYYRSIDKAGNVEITKTKIVKIDKTLPLGSILINNGSAYTTSRNVILTLNAADFISGISQMRFSNYGTEENWTIWEEYAAQKSWALPSGNGTKTVYVQYMDNAGLISTFSNTTVLTVRAPTPVVLNNPSTVTTSSVLLTWSKNNDNDFLCYQIMMSYYPPSYTYGYFYVIATFYDQNAVSYTVTGLQASQTYYFIVRTLNQEQEYSDSNQVSVTTKSSGTTPVTPWPLNTTLMIFVAIVSISVLGLTVKRILKRRHKPKPYTPKPAPKKKTKEETVIYGKPAPVTVAPSVTLPSGEIRCGNCGLVNPPNKKYCRNCGASL